MSLDVTGALARLLVDPDLRRDFLREREATLATLGVREADRAALLTLAEGDLERQARTLVDKRFYAVEALLPRTFLALGGSAQSFFDEHARRFWPQGHRRHLVDARAFVAFLRQRRPTAVRSDEAAMLTVALGERRLALCPVPDLPLAGRRRRALVVVYRGRGGAVRRPAPGSRSPGPRAALRALAEVYGAPLLNSSLMHSKSLALHSLPGKVPVLPPGLYYPDR